MFTSIPLTLCLFFSDDRHGMCTEAFSTLFDVDPSTAFVQPFQIVRFSLVDEFDLLSGAASDDVARIKVFEGTGESFDVPVTDNVFLTRIDRAAFPVKFVAYDAEERVISTRMEEGDGAASRAPIPVKAKTSVRERFRVSAADGTAAIVWAGDITDSYRCTEIQYGPDPNSVGGAGCGPWPRDFSDAQGRPDLLSAVIDITVGRDVFLGGDTPPEVASVTVSFPDGTVADAKVQDGDVLFAFPPAETDAGRVTLRAFDRSGKQIAQRVMKIWK